MIERVEALIAELEERIDELEDCGAPEAEIAPLRERLAAYESEVDAAEAGAWYNQAVSG